MARKTGIGVYTDRLLSGLSEYDDLALKCYLHLPSRQADQGRKVLDDIARTHPTVELVTRTFPRPKIQRLIWSYSDLMPIEAILGPVDLFHGTSFIMPPCRSAKGVLTIYDLTFMLFPAYHDRGMQAVTRHIRRYAGRSDCIIAISEHTKRDVMEHLRIPEERIRVTMLAADERYRVIDDAAATSAVLTKFGVDREYILYTGTLEPRKNIPALIRAYAALKEEMAIPHRLVLAGGKGWLYDGIMESVRTLGLEKDVIFTGYVPDGEMPYLYNGAAVFAYPSFYEGFGLPPLEAMACGCPVVVSSSSSLPEVVGDAGLTVDPHRPEELAEAIGKVLTDGSLRSALREKGLRRAAAFSWKRCVAETLTIYQELLGRGGRS